MNPTRPGLSSAASGGSERDPSLAELIDSAIRKIVTSAVIAAAVIGLAIYSRPSPPRYQVTAADGRIVRIDTNSGTVIACQDGHCAIVLRHGQELEDSLPPAPLTKQNAPPAPALPPPAPAPSPPAR